jgi:hypothetical protein
MKLYQSQLFKMKKIICLGLLIVFIQGCGPSASSNYNSGYRDGYAEGYNTICKISVSPAKGNWDDKNYSTGYSAGQSDGAAKAVSAVRADNCKVARSYFDP